MNFSSRHIEEVIEGFAKLPGVGRKTATRYVLHILRQDGKETEAFAASLINLKNNLKYCAICHNISDKEVCQICSSHNRDKTSLCIVEDIRDVMAIEGTQQYRGVYHVLGGIISPLDGIGPSDLNMESLLNRMAEGAIKEVILALSTTMEGDTTNFYIYSRLKDFKVRVTTIARGIAIGDELEYADEVTLGRSIANRIPYENAFTLK